MSVTFKPTPYHDMFLTWLTEHLADVRLNVDILQVLVGVGVVQSQRAVQSDGDPHPVTHPRQLSHLALLPRVGIKTLLFKQRRNVLFNYTVTYFINGYMVS